jgi:Tfp pilus assembly protein PilF
MSNPAYRRRAYGVIVLVVLLIAAVIGYFVWNSTVPGPSSARYQWMVSAFYPGAIALSANDTDNAPGFLQKATRIVPKEPAAWADLGLYEMMREPADTAQAQKYLDKAESLAPKNSQIDALLGSLAQMNGNFDQAVNYLNKAVALDPTNIKARYRLKKVLDQQAAPNSDANQEAQLQGILAIQPNNLAVLLDLAYLAAKGKQSDLLIQLLRRISAQSAYWSLAGANSPSDPLAQLKTTLASAKASAPDTPVQVRFLLNDLDSTPNYQQALAALGARPLPPTNQPTVGEPVTHFLLLPSPLATPADPDTGLKFETQAIPDGAKAALAVSAWLDLDGPPATMLLQNNDLQVLSKGQTIPLMFPGGPAVTTVGPNAILPIDWNDDKRVDLALAGPSGLRLYQQSKDGPTAFSDVTSQAKLPASVVGGKYSGAWAAPLETAGDLDIVLGAPSGPVTALRNNGDGTFTPIHPFPGAQGVQDFAWVDLDNAGLSDAVLVDKQGRLSIYQNEASGVFKTWILPAGLNHVAAAVGADLDRVGRFSLIVWGQDGALRLLSRKDIADQSADSADAWTITPLAQGTPPAADGSARLYVTDMDNNGSPDIVETSSAGTQVWLSDAQGHLSPLPQQPDVRRASIEIAKDGAANLVGLDAKGQPIRLVGQGAKNYHWQLVRITGKWQADHRDNSFGIGGQIALRAGLLYENQTVSQPVTRFGLGTYSTADGIRIIWPNGYPQAEFGLTPEALFSAEERLGGSCPWLFAWNGHDVAFVTDFLWRSALGLRIGAQNTAGVPMTSDWNRIGGDQLAPHDGYYDFRLTTQLWETYYFDQIKLIVVDHPVGTQMWVDERFCIPPPKLAYHILTGQQPIVRATDNAGHDVTALLAARDEQYVDTFARADYQGLAEPHFLQADLGKAPATPGKQWLIANGWIHPTNSSINLALSFGHHPHPHGVALSIPDGRGGWKVVQPDLGFPEGKNKTILIDLTGLFKPGQERIVRLATNMEIYWDWMATAVEPPNVKSHSQTLALSTADLRYHGFNALLPHKYSQPETPNYDKLAATGQQWRDLTGYYTRYGDVKELLNEIDDRYVIMNAGDEIDLRFKALPPPPAGWTRDYILTGDGWGKDDDISTEYGRTVIPLPSHADKLYTRPPTTLQNDPVYKAHKADWQKYQTRFVSPLQFDRAFLP